MNTSVVFFIPEGWSVVEHIPHQFVNPEKVELVYPDSKKCGFDLSAELSDKKVLNANELDYLLAHLELIPANWKGKYVYFWGTIYRLPDGHLCVRCLYWDGSQQWKWSFCCLDDDFGSNWPAAVASS